MLGLTVGVPEGGLDIRVEAVARTYLEELDRHLPGQPVCLVAVSMASYFALELAQQLRRAGREVPCWWCWTLRAPADGPRSRLGQAAGASGPAAPPRPAPYRRNAGQPPTHEQPEVRDLLPTDGEGPTVDMAQLIEANVQAVIHYNPQPYDRPIAIFRADASFWDSRRANVRGWAGRRLRRAGGPSRPAGNASVDPEPGNVEVLADHLRRLLPPTPTATP
ncbi:hypothetical protein FLP41_02830 (plasmid) [Paracoccus marcusii]|uniref:hypothetical protein n=1 Tax=Paracoccus marcusii TaxID=59779 RepID=UPI002ED4CD12|nr:hypothetical protein FLP41_02830 [Paracoccus marcusii]